MQRRTQRGNSDSHSVIHTERASQLGGKRRACGVSLGGQPAAALSDPASFPLAPDIPRGDVQLAAGCA